MLSREPLLRIGVLSRDPLLKRGVLSRDPLLRRGVLSREPLLCRWQYRDSPLAKFRHSSPFLHKEAQRFLEIRLLNGVPLEKENIQYQSLLNNSAFVRHHNG